MLLIGLVGTLGSGKSTATDYLETQGFEYFRLSDIIREKFKLKAADRTKLQDLGNKLRQVNGNDFLAREVWKKIEASGAKKVVIDGLRNVREVDFLRKKKNFYLISIDKDQKSRFKRLKIRGSDRDPKSWAEFVALDERDLKEDKEYGQQTREVMKMADFSLTNNLPIEFLLDLEKILKKINNK